MAWTLIKICAFFVWNNKLNAAKVFILPNLIFYVCLAIIAFPYVQGIFWIMDDSIYDTTSDTYQIILFSLLTAFWLIPVIFSYLYCVYAPMNRWFRFVVDGTEIGDNFLPKFSSKELFTGFLLLLMVVIEVIVLILPVLFFFLLAFLHNLGSIYVLEILSFLLFPAIPFIIIYVVFAFWILIRMSMNFVAFSVGGPINPITALKLSSDYKLTFFLVLVLFMAITIIIGGIFAIIALITILGWLFYAVYYFFYMVFSFTDRACIYKLTKGTLVKT